MKKILALVLALAMVLLCVGAFAASDGTITVTNATKGITYKAYKVFDATYSGDAVNYTVPTAYKDKVSTTLFDISTVADENGNWSVSKKSTATDAEVIAWVKSNYQNFYNTAIDGTWGDDSTFVFSGLDYGYYYITSSLGSVVTIDSALKDADVKDKNDSTPDEPDKEIVGENDADFNAKKLNEAGVGSTEDFEVTFDAVNWITSTNASGAVTTTQARVYKFSDAPTGLDIDTNTIKVYVTDNGTEKEITNTITGLAEATNGTVSFSIPWVDSDNNSLYQPKVAGTGETQTAKIPVRVTYTATVTAAAAVAVAPNHVDIKYTNSNNQDVDVGDDETETYTYKFKLDKSKADYTDLLGAKFQLYAGSSIAANATPLTFTMNNGNYQLDPNGTVDTIDLTTVATATIIGLDKADYTLRETVVPAGYNQAADQVVASTALVRVDETITDVAATITGDVGVVTVVNNAGSELPSTGGIGTTIFYILGGLLVIGAAVVLVARRKAHD